MKTLSVHWVWNGTGFMSAFNSDTILTGWDPAIERTIRRNITTFIGRNVTKSNSGACGVNQPKVIELPVRMEKIS